MPISTRAVVVTTAATRLDSDDRSGSVAVYNAGAVTIYLGGADVTTATGTPVAAGEHYALDLGQSSPLYARAASDCAVRVLEEA